MKEYKKNNNINSENKTEPKKTWLKYKEAKQNNNNKKLNG